MKRFATISGIVAILALLCTVPHKAGAQVSVNVSYQTFYDELDPYGDWIDYPDYGYVWQPRMGAGFRPYSTNGHWVFADDYGWTWVSNYSWGWAPFHYGRWFEDPYYGWLWIPGYDWSPAWVQWRGGGDYYGWAPLGPQFSVGVSFSFGGYSPPANHWCFVGRQYITSPNVYNHYVNVQRNTTIINNTTVINNYSRNRNVFVTGPGRRDVERYANVRSVSFRESSRPGRSEFRNNQVTMYRPRVERDNNRRFTPGNVRRFEGRGNVADTRGRNREWNNRSQGNNQPGRTENVRGRGRENVFEQRRQQQPQRDGRRDEMFGQRRQQQERNNAFEQQRRQQQERNVFEQQRRQQQERNNAFEQQRRQQQERQRGEVFNQRRRDNTFEQRRQQPEQQRRERTAESNGRNFGQRSNPPETRSGGGSNRFGRQDRNPGGFSRGAGGERRQQNEGDRSSDRGQGGWRRQS